MGHIRVTRPDPVCLDHFTFEEKRERGGKMGRLISKVIEWGLVLAVAGQLRSVTLEMLRRAPGKTRPKTAPRGEWAANTWRENLESRESARSLTPRVDPAAEWLKAQRVDFRPSEKGF